MRWILIMLLLLSASIGSAYFLVQSNERDLPKRPVQVEKVESTQLQTLQEDKFVKAQLEAVKESCVNEARKSEDAKKSGLDIPGFCGCIVGAHMKLDHSIAGEKEKRLEFSQKGKPCFEKYLKPVIFKSCAQVRASSGMSINCECMYAYAAREHVLHWIQGTEGKARTPLNDQEKEKRKLDVGMQIIKKCIK